MAKTISTWGYRGPEAQIFDLAPGDALPDGWDDRPARGYHPHDVAAGIEPEPQIEAAPAPEPEPEPAPARKKR